MKSFKTKNRLKQGTETVIQQAYFGIIELSRGRTIKVEAIKQQQKKDYTISKYVDFILSDDNVVLVAWGTKKALSQSKGEVLLPKLTRKVRIQKVP